MAGLLDSLFRPGPVAEIFSDRARLQGMLDFEAALARAEERVGIVPRNVAKIIAKECDATRFHLGELADATLLAGNPAIPTVNALVALVAQKSHKASGYVHWGATSQDAMDTGLVLQLRSALELIDAHAARLSLALARLARKYRKAPMAGRTWLQQAVPVTFGLKAAGALTAVERHRERLRELRARVLVIQFGGAAGTLASLGTRGPDVAKALAFELKLGNPEMPWHAHRDRVAEVATTLGLLTATLGKIAKDISLLMQPEIGEAAEPGAPGKGGSSTMPHKRNPVHAAVVLAAAVKMPSLVAIMLSAVVQEHERGLGTWHAEWETLPEICMLCAGALAHLTQAIEGLEVDTRRMRSNLDASGGLVLAEAVSAALALKMGRPAAHALVEAASRRALQLHTPLLDVLAQDATATKHLSGEELKRLFEPANYLGAAQVFVDRALATRAGRKK